MTTLAQLRTRVQDHTHRPIGPSDEVDRLVNDAYRAVVTDMRTDYAGVVLTLVAGTSDYNLVTDLVADPVTVAVEYVEYTRNAISLPLGQVSFAQMLRYRGANPAITDGAYYYSFVPPASLSLYPTPATGDTAKVWGWFEPAALSGDSTAVNTTFVPERWVDLIVLKACIVAVRSLNQGRNAQGIQMSASFRNDYQAELGSYRRERNYSGGSNTRVVEYGPRRAPRTANDVYLGAWD